MSVDATIATWKLTKNQVTPIQKLILLSYADRAGESFECWPSNKRLQQDTGLNLHTICENKQELIKKGLMSYTGEKKGKTKSIDVIRLNYVQPREGYTKDVHDDEYQSNAENVTPSTQNNTNLSTSNAENGIAKQCGKQHTEPKRREEPINNNITPKPPCYSQNDSHQNVIDYQPRLNEECTPEELHQQAFDIFWSIYPKKHGKKGSFRIWMKEISPLDVHEIIFNLQKQIEEDSAFKQGFIPNPEKYLSDERWKDEIFVMPNKQKNQSTDDESDDWSTNIYNEFGF